MPYEGVGARHTAVATKECRHGQIVTEDGFVGSAFKVTQPDRFVRPADAQDIAIGEEFEIQIGGVHEVALVAPFEAADVGDQIWIDPTDNSLDDATGAGYLPLGVITEVDASRTPEVARVNSNAWQAFLPGA
jgi:hypothetical protein